MAREIPCFPKIHLFRMALLLDMAKFLGLMGGEMGLIRVGKGMRVVFG